MENPTALRLEAARYRRLAGFACGATARSFIDIADALERQAAGTEGAPPPESDRLPLRDAVGP